MMVWTIRSKSMDEETLLLEESLFFNGNGYIGVRGNFEESDTNTQTIRGTYLNAFHDIIEIPYGEKLYGFPDTQQKLLNIIDAQTIEIWVGEGDAREKFSLHSGEVISYERILHMDKGFTERKVHWKSPSGYELVINFKRLVSFNTRELFSQFITITPIDEAIPVEIVSLLTADVENFTDATDPRVAQGDAKRLHVRQVEMIDNASYVEVETYQSKLRAAALSTIEVSDDAAIYQYDVQENLIKTSIKFTLKRETTVEKRTFFVDTLRHEFVRDMLEQIHQDCTLRFPEILVLQEEYMHRFWNNTDITIQGKAELQEGIRFNLYHLLQSAGQDGLSNISAKGLSGEGYEGHYFWDTEIYLLPVFTLTNPELAKKLLLYRYSTLEQARDRAKELGHQQGALFPWRTISGTECSSYYPAGTAQYHISADIAHSYIQYYLATDDVLFMEDFGVELLIDTARLWIDTGHFLADEFRIDNVTGPDEYTCVINNNYYTNTMAKQNLAWAVKAANLVAEQAPEKWESLKRRLSLQDGELDVFNRAAELMYLPVDDALQINPQDDTFLKKKVWDFEHVPKDKYPLLLHYHPLTLYRYQVCKQADTVLAHALSEDEQSDEVMKNSYDYYEKITTHDSSLSSCIFSIMGARVGYLDKAYDYFIETARLDLDNTHGNTKDGLHMANMGGTWLSIVAGFAGLRIKETGIYFRPQLPSEWEGYSFRMQYQGRPLHVSISEQVFSITLLSGPDLLVNVWDKEMTLQVAEPISFNL